MRLKQLHARKPLLTDSKKWEGQFTSGLIDYGEGLHLSSRTRVVDCQETHNLICIRDSLRIEATPGKDKDMAKRESGQENPTKYPSIGVYI